MNITAEALKLILGQQPVLDEHSNPPPLTLTWRWALMVACKTAVVSVVSKIFCFTWISPEKSQFLPSRPLHKSIQLFRPKPPANAAWLQRTGRKFTLDTHTNTCTHSHTQHLYTNSFFGWVYSVFRKAFPQRNKPRRLSPPHCCCYLTGQHLSLTDCAHSVAFPPVCG